MSKLNYSKTTLISAFFLSLIVLVSACSTEEPFETLEVSNGPEDLRGTPPPLVGGYILAQLVPTGTCFNLHNGLPGTTYSLRATSGLTTAPYDRIVHMGVVDNQAGVDTIVATAILTIPANQTQSQLIQVFDNATMNYGGVEVKIFTVFHGNTNWNITNQFETRNTEPTINNCYISNNGGPGIDPCGISGDSNGDGICDYVGMDN